MTFQKFKKQFPIQAKNDKSYIQEAIHAGVLQKSAVKNPKDSVQKENEIELLASQMNKIQPI